MPLREDEIQQVYEIAKKVVKEELAAVSKPKEKIAAIEPEVVTEKKANKTK